MHRDKNKQRWMVKKCDYKRRYGLTMEDVETLFVSQDGNCAVCLKEFKNRMDMCVDHNHTTNKVRGLLCRKCNLAIGHLNEDVLIAQRVVDYLNKWRQ